MTCAYTYTDHAPTMRGLVRFFNYLNECGRSKNCPEDYESVSIRYISHIYSFSLPALSACLSKDRRSERFLLNWCYQYLSRNNYLFLEADFYASLSVEIENNSIAYLAAESAFVTIQCLLVARLGEIVFIREGGNFSAADISSLLDSIASTTKVAADSIGAQIFPYESLLSADPASLYDWMDASSKRQYRIATCDIARRNKVTEEDCLKKAIELSSIALASGDHSIKSHIGYYLIDDGRSELARLIGSGIRQRIINHRPAMRLAAYASIFSLVNALLTVPLIFIGRHFFLLYPASIFFIYLIAYDAVASFTEKRLGRSMGERNIASLDYEQSGIPDHSRCGIVMPTILSSFNQIDRTIRNLERNYRAASDSNVFAIILTDYMDSEEKWPSVYDKDLLAYCVSKIHDLNAKYKVDSQLPFAIMHRDRLYSHSEQMFIGYERKRGKLNAFNRFVVGSCDEFSLKVGDIDRLHSLRYALVVDDDCIIRENSIQKLVGAMSHPLNWPVLCEQTNSVERGYGMMVPCTLTSREASVIWRFPALIAPPIERPEEQLEPTRNFLFEAFGRCQYPGKGIYDIAVFEKTLAGRFPHDLILSHDTLESAWIRPAYFGDACIIEGVPDDFSGLISRQHRWIRGNLQNLFYVLSNRNLGLPDAFWIVLINQLRIDITAVFTSVILLIFVFSRETESKPLAALMLSILLVAPLIGLSICLISQELINGKLKNSFHLLKELVIQLVANLTYKIFICPTHSLLYIDAFFRTIYRLIAKRKLLQWHPASAHGEGGYKSKLHIYSCVTSLMGFISLAYLLVTGGTSATSLSITVLWLICPFLIKHMKKNLSSAL